MNQRGPVLTNDLLRRALAVPTATPVPVDLHRSIAAAVRVTRQRPARVGSLMTATFWAQPRPVRLAVTALLVLALVIGLVAVGARLFPRPGPLSDSTTFRGDAARTGVVSGPGPGGAMSVAFQTKLAGQILSSAAVVDGIAYLGATDGRFRAFDLHRGVEAWSAELDVAWSSPSVAGNLVVVGTEDRALVALDRATGALAWRVSLDGFAAGSPAIVGDRLFVATSSDRSHGRNDPGATGKVVAIDLPTHEIAWQEDLPGPSTRSIAVQGSILVVPTDVGIAVAFDTATARELWRVPTEAVTDTPVIAGGMVLFAGLDPEGTRGALWAVNLEAGRLVWHHQRPSRQTIEAPVVDAGAGLVYVGTVDGDVVALRLADGAEVWTQHLGAEIASSPTKAGDILYVASSTGIAALLARTGQVLGTLPLDGIPFSPAVSGGYLIVGTQSGSLYALISADDGVGANPPSPAAVASGPPSVGQSPTASVSSSVAPLVEAWARTAEDLGIGLPFYLNGAPDGRLWIADSTRGRFVIVAPDGTVVDTWQPTGDGALDLVQPDADGWGAIAFTSDGDSFVADSDHQRVLRFDAARQLIGSWGSFGSGDGRFVSPFGITVGPDGLVYVVDDSTCRVQVFDPSGTHVRTFAGGTEYADRCTNNVVVSRDGRVFLASGGRGTPWRITMFSPEGAIVGQLGEGLLREPVLLAPGPNGDFYATDGTDRLHRFAANGHLMESWSGPGLETVVVGLDGDIFAAGLEGLVRRYAPP
jgi:outer membrane protein assembly factor BamB